MADAYSCTNHVAPEDLANRNRAMRPALPSPDGSESWYRITNAIEPTDNPCLYLYGDIGSWGITAAQCIAELSEMTAPVIDVYISSPGGEVFEGLALYSALRAHRAKIMVRIDSLAASIASVIAMAGDRVTISPGAQVMIHDANTVVCGDPAELRKTADFLDAQSDNIAAIYQERAGGTVKQWRARMIEETWYFADEAVAAGLADEVGKPARQDTTAEAAAMAAAWDLKVYNYAHERREDAPAPLIETAPEAPPAPEPAAPAPVFDPAAFTAATAAALDPGPMPGFEADRFRDLMGSVATTAPAPPQQRPPTPAPVETPPEAETETDPTPTVMPDFDPAAFRTSTRAAFDPMPDYDPNRFRGLMAGIADDAPADPGPARPETAYVPPPADTVPEPDTEQVAVGWFRSLFTAAANDAPAPPRIERPAPAAPEPIAVHAPEPPAPAHEVAVDYMRTLMANAANDLAAPEQAAAPDPAPAEPVPALDPKSFERSLKEARL
jgi:ATP-dependent protease ClpP protease subunit